MDQLLFEFAIDPRHCQLCKGTRRTNPKCLFRGHAEDLEPREMVTRSLAPVFLARDPIMVAVPRNDLGLILTNVETGHSIKLSPLGSSQLIDWIRANLKGQL